MGQARKHHYVPQCLLLGFAVPQTNTGRLFVLDAKRRQVFASSPANSAHRRDYNLVSAETHPKPLVVEDFYANIESLAAPVLAQMRETRKLSDGEGLANVLRLVAIQFTRTPRFRRWLEGRLFSAFEQKILRMGRTSRGRKRFSEQQRTLGVPKPYWTPEAYLALHKNGDFSTTSDDNWKIAVSSNHLPAFMHALQLRKWVLTPFSAANEPLITSDAGVGLMPFRKPGIVGLGRPDNIVYMPISSQLVFAGYFRNSIPVLDLDRALRPRKLNVCTFANSLDQCFSVEPDFIVEDPDRGPTKWSTYQSEGTFPKLGWDIGDLADVYAGETRGQGAQ